MPRSSEQELLAQSTPAAPSIAQAPSAVCLHFPAGVQRIVHFNDIVIDNGSVTFHIWNVDECWIKWQQSMAAKSGAAPPMVMDRNRTLRRRAQVAAILGNDSSKSIRTRLAMRKQNAQHIAAYGCFPSAGKAAREVLLHPSGALDVEFFRREPLSLKTFNAEDLEAFNAQVQEYIDADAAARAPEAVEQLAVGPKSLPWLAEPLLRRLKEDVVPSLLLSFAGRGLGALTAPLAHWLPLQVRAWRGWWAQRGWCRAGVGTHNSSIEQYPSPAPGQTVKLRRHVSQSAVPSLPIALRSIRHCALIPALPCLPQALRRAAAEKLHAPGAVHEYCPVNNTLHLLAAAPASPADPGASPKAQWFNPAKHLPGVKVVDSTAAAGTVPAAGESLAATLAAIKAATPGLPDALALWAAVLVHALEAPAAGTGEAEAAAAQASYRAAVRELLLPGMPSAAQLHRSRLAAAAEAREAEEEEDRAAAAGTGSAGSVMVPVGSLLSDKDWLDIDASDVSVGGGVCGRRRVGGEVWGGVRV